MIVIVMDYSWTAMGVYSAVPQTPATEAPSTPSSPTSPLPTSLSLLRVDASRAAGSEAVAPSQMEIELSAIVTASDGDRV